MIEVAIGETTSITLTSEAGDTAKIEIMCVADSGPVMSNCDYCAFKNFGSLCAIVNCTYDDREDRNDVHYKVIKSEITKAII